MKGSNYRTMVNGLTTGIAIAAVFALIVLAYIYWPTTSSTASSIVPRRIRERSSMKSGLLPGEEPRNIPATAIQGSGATSTPPIIMKSDVGENASLMVPGAQAYQRLATEVFEEDLETQINRKMFAESKRPMPEPLAWDQFRWTGSYDISSYDPYLSNPMYRKTTNKGSNDGQSLWTHNNRNEWQSHWSVD